MRSAAGLALLLAACADSGESDAEPGATGGTGGATIEVGLINSYTGDFATMAEGFENGFMAALDHRTDGTMEVAGHAIEIVTADDTGDPAVGTTKARELIGDGVHVLAGPTNSAVALAVAEQAVQNDVLYLGGTSGTADLVGMDDLVFATSGTSPAGTTLTIKALPDDLDGLTLAFIGQDYAYGQDVAEATRAQFEPLGMAVETFLLPQTTTEFTPLALQLKDLQPDYVMSAWAGAGQDQLWSALQAQEVTASTTVFGYLYLRAGFTAQAESVGSGVEDAVFLTNYFEGATGNEAEAALIAYAEEHEHVIEYADAVGWHAAEMLIQGIEEGGDDPQAMAEAIKDWSFTGPGGEVLVRGEDNQVTVPGFSTRLEEQPDGSWFPNIREAFDATELEPEVVRPIEG